MKNTDFITVSSYIRTLESRLLTKSKLDSLISLHHFSDITKGLSQDTDYNFTTVSTLDQAEAVLKEEWERVCKMLSKVSPHQGAVEIMRLPYEFHAFRRVWKEDMSKTEKTAPLSENRKKLWLEVAAMEESSQIKEIYLDKKMFESMIEISQELNSALITEQVQMKIDFYNIKAMLRAREMDKDAAFFELCYQKGGRLAKHVLVRNYSLPFSSLAASFSNKYCNEEVQKGLEAFEGQHNFSELETLFHSSLIRHVKNARFISYGPEILYAYLMAKENEIRQIRLLLTCKFRNISDSILIGKLGESYV